MSIYPSLGNDYLDNINYNATVQTDQFKNKFEGIELNESGQNVNVPVIYGNRRIVPPRIFTAVKNNDSSILICAYAISEGPITKVDKLFVDDVQVPIGLSSGKYIVQSGTYAGLVTMEVFTGETNDGSSTLMTEVTGNVNDTVPFKLACANMAYAVIKFRFQAPSPFKEMPKIQLEVCGRKLRTADANFASNSVTNQLQDSNVTDVLLDYLTNTRYGRGISDSKIDATSLAAMRVSFETALQGFIAGPTYKRGSCNLVLDTAKSVQDNIRELCRQFGIVMTYANGKYRFTAEYSVSSTAGSIQDSDVLNGYSRSIPNLSNRLNKVIVTYVDKDYNFNIYSQAYNNATFLSDDNNLVLEQTIDFTAITNAYLARFAAESICRKSRAQQQIRWRMTKKALYYTVGDVVNMIGGLGRVMITGMTMNDDFTFDIEAVSHNNTLYPPFTLQARQDYTIYTPSNPQPNPTQPSELPRISLFPTRPATARQNTITIGSLSTLTLTGAFGSTFYRGPVRNSRLNVSVDPANFSQDTSFAYNSTGTNNGFGVLYKFLYNNAGSAKTGWYDYLPFITFRNRDLDNANGEGKLVVGSRIYDKIYYVYEIEPSQSGAPNFEYGWVSTAQGTAQTQEWFFFDPSKDLLATRRYNGISTTGFRPADCLQGRLGPDVNTTSGSTLYGCPYLEYDVNRGYYTPVQNLYGLRYFARYDNKIGKIWEIPQTVWTYKTGQSDLAPNQLTTLTCANIKLFVILDDGRPLNIATMSISLKPQRIAQNSTAWLTSSRTNYQTGAGLGTPPF